jgi:hypothetical protein
MNSILTMFDFSKLVPKLQDAHGFHIPKMKINLEVLGIL